MATIAENLTKLQTARTNIANAITAKGGTVSQGDGFEDFPNDIASIPAGSGAVKLTLLPTYPYITANEFYIFEGETYIYCYGYFAGGSTIGLSIPQDFNIDKIGTVNKGGYYANTSGSTTNVSVDKTNRTITFNAGDGNVSRIVLITFNKATS